MIRAVVILLMTSLVIAGAVSWFASGDPDGLERVAENHHFAERAVDPSWEIMPDYTVPGLDGPLSNGLAGIIGVLVTFGVVSLAGKLVTSKRRGDG